MLKKIKHPLFKKIKLTSIEIKQIKSQISCWNNLHFFLSEYPDNKELILNALYVEITTKKRKNIIKRLYQRYAKLNNRDQFNSLIELL